MLVCCGQAFNAALGSKLLYHFERVQYAELIEVNPFIENSQRYAAEHLLRLFVALVPHLRVRLFLLLFLFIPPPPLIPVYYSIWVTEPELLAIKRCRRCPCGRVGGRRESHSTPYPQPPPAAR